MTEDLQKTVERLRNRIGKLLAKPHSVNEQETKSALITPMLRVLGWDCEEAEAVRLEYRYRGQGNPVDYALMVDERPRVFIEAKALGKDLGEYRWREQTVNYANSAGVSWCVLTDGNFWLVYKSNGEGDLEQKRFLEVCLQPLDGKVPADQPADVLSLLSLESVSADALNSRWQALDLDRRGTRALRALFDGRNASLVRLVQKHSNLAKAEVLDLLSRARVTVEPMASPEIATKLTPAQPPVEVLAPTRPTKARAKAKAGDRNTKVRMDDVVEALNPDGVLAADIREDDAPTRYATKHLTARDLGERLAKEKEKGTARGVALCLIVEQNLTDSEIVAAVNEAIPNGVKQKDGPRRGVTEVDIAGWRNLLNVGRVPWYGVHLDKRL